MGPAFAKGPGAAGFTRRDVLRGGRDLATLLSLSTLAGVESPLVAPAEAAQDARRASPDVYRAIGIKPLVNARGTFTIISGSLMLPEVRAAMDAAARHYVHLDELAEAIGARLATLTGAEWGLVTSGCSAALTHATAACIAGGNPDLHVRIPNLTGFAKDEVIIPRHSRNVYDAAVRSVGARVIEVSTVADLDAALGPRTAMIYILAGNGADQSVLNTKAIAQLANPKGVPILVDAAAEILTVPNVHLQNGATLVAYSGGKCLRGPQTAGLLLGTQRAASRSRARDEGGQGRSHRHAHRRRNVDEARPRCRMETVDGVDRSHLAARDVDSWRDHNGHTAQRPVEPHTFTARVVGSATLRILRRNRRAGARRNGTAHRTHGRAQAWPARGDRRLRHAVHDVGWGRDDRRRSIACAVDVARAA
jgi:hypothetical protein